MIAKLDGICHGLRLPRWLMRPLCDRYERSLLAGSDAALPSDASRWISTDGQAQMSGYGIVGTPTFNGQPMIPIWTR